MYHVLINEDSTVKYKLWFYTKKDRHTQTKQRKCWVHVLSDLWAAHTEIDDEINNI